MPEPLYTAAEMKAAEAGHDVDELMARAGRAVAEEAMRRFPMRGGSPPSAVEGRTGATGGSRSTCFAQRAARRRQGTTSAGRT